MVLVQMRLGLFELDLAGRFDVHVSTVNRICTSWINCMYLKFGYLNIWSERDTIYKAMPSLLEKRTRHTKAIQHSKGLLELAQVATFIFPSYILVVFLTESTIKSGRVKLHFCSGDIVMADKRFTIADILEPLKVKSEHSSIC